MRKIRIYDLAKELRVEAKVLIKEARALGCSVKVPSNGISREAAERIRKKYGAKDNRGEPVLEAMPPAEPAGLHPRTERCLRPSEDETGDE